MLDTGENISSDLHMHTMACMITPPHTHTQGESEREHREKTEERVKKNEY